jgi:hypothetical protein
MAILKEQSGDRNEDAGGPVHFAALCCSSSCSTILNGGLNLILRPFYSRYSFLKIIFLPLPRNTHS